jgi:hypothetical protein
MQHLQREGIKKEVSATVIPITALAHQLHHLTTSTIYNNG